MSNTVVVLLGLLAWALILGPLFLLWWLPDHLEVRELKRRSADRYRHRAGIR